MRGRSIWNALDLPSRDSGSIPPAFLHYYLLALIKVGVMIPSLRSLVSKNKKAHFVRYYEGELFYKTDCGFIFPIPIAESDKFPFHAKEDTTGLIRWIQRQREFLLQHEKSQYVTICDCSLCKAYAKQQQPVSRADFTNVTTVNGEVTGSSPVSS